MALAGYPSHLYMDCTTRKTPYTANLDCIRTAENEVLLNNFMNNLFQIRATPFFRYGRLRPAVERYMAAVLINHDAMRSNYGSNNYVVRLTERCALDLQITHTILTDWGNVIRDDVNAHITELKGKGGDVDSLLLVELINNHATQAKRDKIEILKEVTAQHHEILALKGMITNLEILLKVSLEKGSPSSTRKRKVRLIFMLYYYLIPHYFLI